MPDLPDGLKVFLEELRRECTVELIPEIASEDEARAYIEGNYAEWFEFELNAWNPERVSWRAGKLRKGIEKVWLEKKRNF